MTAKRDAENQGFPDSNIREYEIRHREIARRAAAGGMVLLKNENHLLPLKNGTKIALFGAGAGKTVKGGTGSGDVNERESISIRQGLQEAGFVITTNRWLDSYELIFQKAREAWKKSILSKANRTDFIDFFNAYSNTPFRYPEGDPVYETETDIAIYIISRIAGEGADRKDEAGDYRLSLKEKEDIQNLNALYNHVTVIINTGGLIDLSFLDENENIDALLYIVQPGMEGGHAVADILSGRVQPSGKLTDTWAMNYEDYPEASSFSANDGNPDRNEYKEGIYEGYRYFDSFDIPVRYTFGYGLSYTEFELMKADIVTNAENCSVSVKVSVRNIGNVFPGRETVQIYVSCPEGKLDKEYRRLIGFAKTKLLAPGKEQELIITFSPRELASYDETLPGWVVEKGEYGIWIGDSLKNSNVAGILSLGRDTVIEYTKNVCIPKKEINLSTAAGLRHRKKFADLNEGEGLENIPVVMIDSIMPEEKNTIYQKRPLYTSAEAEKLASKLTDEQMIFLVTGDVGKGQGAALGSAGINVPGSAGQTSDCAENLGIGEMVLADGPAGLRLESSFSIKDGMIQKKDFCCSIEHGFFGNVKDEKGIVRYQYCTAFPVGTLMAQSWDTELVKEIGHAVAEEMQLFGVTLWLAPGMNIHRNPLCGRNFEYFSEDPLISGKMAAAVTNGVQNVHGCGTTIKHFACNNAEDDRMGSDSVLTERALREIYLRGFEIAVKESQPCAIMTSYNRINGVHSANNYNLCTDIARNEWHFKGLIMTDWTTTTNSPDQKNCTASGCIRAGNDLIMPGSFKDHENLQVELRNGELDESDLRGSCTRIIDMVLKTR